MPSQREVFDFEPLTPTGRVRGDLSARDAHGSFDDEPPLGAHGDYEKSTAHGNYEEITASPASVNEHEASTSADGEHAASLTPHQNYGSARDEFERATDGDEAAYGDQAARTTAQPHGDAATSDASSAGTRSVSALRRGHSITYFWLFLFTVFLYVRPYEFIPALEPFSQFAFPLGVITILIFLPSQLALEGTLTARPREIVLVALLCLAGLLSIPLATNPAEAWQTFADVFIKAVLMFVVLVNVVRTERRLKQLIVIAALAGCILSLGALRDYLAGNFTVEGYRVKGNLRGWMDNTNDMAIHFVMMIPVVAALCIASRGVLRKLLYAGAGALMLAGTVVTFSRGAFLGLSCAAATFCLKLARRNRFAVAVLLVFGLFVFVAAAPSNYSNRLLSIIDHSRDPNGSASMRQVVLSHSLLVALRHPLFGVGMGNFHIYSVRELVSHNAYTQVASEMGFAALVVYVLFVVTPMRRLAGVERETYDARRERRRLYYYLSVGLQASLVAYMVSSFFASVAYIWFIYYFAGFAVALRRMYESEVGHEVLTPREEKRVRKAQARAHAQERAQAEARTGEPAFAGPTAAPRDLPFEDGSPGLGATRA